MIPSICGRFNTNTRLDEVSLFIFNNKESVEQTFSQVKAFFDKYRDAGAGAAARLQTIADITNRIKWLESNEESVAKWLNENYQTQYVKNGKRMYVPKYYT